MVKQARLHESGDRVHQSRPAQPGRLAVADHGQRQLVRRYRDTLDRALGSAHPAPDGRALECWPGGRCGGQQPVPVAEHDLAVGADVDEQPGPGVPVHARGEQPGCDVAAHVGAERGEHERPRPRMNRDCQVGGEHFRQLPGRHDEGGNPERLGVDAQSDVRHRRVPGNCDLGDVRRVRTGLRAHLCCQLGQGLMRELAHPVQCRRVQHGGADPGDDVRPEWLLLVEHRRDRERCARG